MIPAASVAELTRVSRAEQGLPPQVEDSEPLNRIADLLKVEPQQSMVRRSA